MNKFQKSLDRVKANLPLHDDKWTDEDKEHITTVMEALEKQIPKKVEFVDGGNALLCPCCKYDLMGCEVDPVHDPYYCLECGQALDWSENK